MRNSTLFCYMCFFLLVSCSSYKQIAYLQGAQSEAEYADTVPAFMSESKLKVGDLLIITVNTITPEVAVPFNLPVIPMPNSVASGVTLSNPQATSSVALQNYLINKEGNIMYPVIGNIKAAGMTKSQLAEYIKRQIYPQYIKEIPIVNIRYVNFKVSVLGEVARPSIYTIDNEQVNLLEAIAMAGDLTIYGQRKDVLLVREAGDGKHVIVHLDLTDKDIVNSPYYYLQQNDVLYVQPNKSRARSASFGTAESLTVSIIGTLISLASLIAIIVRK